MPVKTIVLAITGASGAVYAKRLFDYIHTETTCEIRLIISDNGYIVLKSELGIDQSYFFKERVILYDNNTMNVPIASGSAKTDAMVIIPATMNAIARIVTGISYDLIARTADVMLKERKTLVLVARESPYNTIHLENMLKMSKIGGVIVPASPGFYNRPKSIDDLVDFVVSKTLNQLGIENMLIPAWNPDLNIKK